MASRHLVVLAGIMVLTLSTCVVSETGGKGGITGSDEEFRIKYQGLDPVYYGQIVDIETLAAKGKKLYDDYFKQKTKRNKVDIQTRRRAREILDRALQKCWRIYQDTKNGSVLVVQQRVSTWIQDLLREVEQPGRPGETGVPK